MLLSCSSHIPSLGPFSSAPALSCPHTLCWSPGLLLDRGEALAQSGCRCPAPLFKTSLLLHVLPSSFQLCPPQLPTLPLLPPPLQALTPRSTNILQFSPFSKENPPQFFFSFKLPLSLSPLFHHQISWGRKDSMCPFQPAAP